MENGKDIVFLNNQTFLCYYYYYLSLLFIFLFNKIIALSVIIDNLTRERM